VVFAIEEVALGTVTEQIEFIRVRGRRIKVMKALWLLNFKHKLNDIK
jgi:hypothetical protein